MSITSALVLATITACGGGGDGASTDIALERAAVKTPKPPPSKTTNSTTTTTTTTPTTTSTLPAPAPAAFNCAADAITCVEVTSTSSQVQASLPVTFGQPFKAGDWNPASQGLIAKVDGATIPLQTDELSTHRDGSARFAVLSAQLNNIQPGQTSIVNIYPGAKASSTPNVPATPDWNLELEAQVYDASGAVTTLVAQPQADLVKQINDGTGRRLAGAVASEYTIALPFKDKATGVQHPHLTARLHTRLVDGGQRIRTDVVVENTRTWTASPGNITYSFAVKRNGSTIYTQPKFTHYHHARWHKVLWTGASAEPQARVRQNMPYFMASKAVWNYDLNIQVPETEVANWAGYLRDARIAQAALGPMANALLQKEFPTTGARSDIGPLPRWTALFLLSQDERLREVMLANGDAAAAVPVHYRDEKTGQVIDVVTNPTASVYTGQTTPAVVNGDTIWTPDTAHQASFVYVPYLISGDAFYLEEMAYWAGWNIAALYPPYRQESKGLFDGIQTRAQAWGMRSVAEAAFALPDNHPMKGYFKSILANNLDHYATFPNLPQLPPMGALLDNGTDTITAVWQNDFMGIVFSLMVENNEPNANVILDWISRFNVGRFINENNSFCIANAMGNYWTTRRPDRTFINSWSEFYAINFPGDVGKPCSSVAITGGYPELPSGSAAMARAMLAATSNAGITGAPAGYQAWKAKTPLMDAGFATDPTWAIVPRK